MKNKIIHKNTKKSKKMQKNVIIKGRYMRKIIILFILTIIVIAIVAFNYMGYKTDYNSIQKYNLEFEENFHKEIYGTDLTTIINRVINNNEKNNVEIGQDKKYINNGIDSINVDIKMTDIDAVYPMETIYNGAGGMEEFVKHYGNIKFTCTNIEYHKQTGKVSYLYFEQISK